jgi:NADH:ubiquinone oxidoreductase subunit 4 (subunit M)
MVLLGSFQRAWSGVAFEWRTSYLTMAVASVVGVVLGAWYMLQAVQRVFFGGSREPPRASGHGHDAGHAAHGHGGHGGHGAAGTDHDRCDLRWYELCAVLPLAVFVFWIGLAPATFLAPAAPAVRKATAAPAAAFAARMQAETTATVARITIP